MKRRKFHPGFFGNSTMRLFIGGSEDDRAVSVETREDRSLTPELRSALDLLRFADPGIDDYEMADEASPYSEDPGRRRLRLVHRVHDEPVAFDLDEESAGTRTWFHLLGPVLAALRDGRILVFDEIDASLHPRLSVRLLEIFQGPETNPRGAQLVFTSHDTSLLNALNRDEVWLTEKDSGGATGLVALAEFPGREGEEVSEPGEGVSAGPFRSRPGSRSGRSQKSPGACFRHPRWPCLAGPAPGAAQGRIVASSAWHAHSPSGLSWCSAKARGRSPTTSMR